jgi:FAD/FMN-containing dehydrogenase
MARRPRGDVAAGDGRRPAGEAPLSLAADPSLAELRRSFAGSLVLPADVGYDEARRVWNPAVDRRPALVAWCEGRGDVVAAVAMARRSGLPVSVRGAGHSFHGFGVCAGGVVIDVSRMKDVRVQPVRRTAVVEPGLTWAELDGVTQAFGLAAPGGSTSSVGVAGMTLGGGIGWLNRRFGLAIDSLESAEVVLADGRVVVAGEDEHPELHWALRGGGGNFGIVTSLRFRLHPVRDVVRCLVIHPLSRARDVLRMYRELAADAPDDVRLQAMLVTASAHATLPAEVHGRPVAILTAAHFGTPGSAETLLRSVRRLGTPLVERFGPVGYDRLQRSEPGLRLFHYGDSEFVNALPDHVIDAAAEAVEDARSPFVLVALNQLGGSMGRVPADASAFAHRSAAHLAGLHVMWDPAEPAEPHRAWVRRVRRALQAGSAGASYVNMLEDQEPDRVRAAYGPANYDRLARVKAAYDPDNFFRANHNVRPDLRAGLAAGAPT